MFFFRPNRFNFLPDFGYAIFPLDGRVIRGNSVTNNTLRGVASERIVISEHDLSVSMHINCDKPIVYFDITSNIPRSCCGENPRSFSWDSNGKFSIGVGLHDFCWSG